MQAQKGSNRIYFLSLTEFAETSRRGAIKNITIGDCVINDGPMIEAAGCGVAMNNANEEIMKKVDYVTEKDNNDDGVGDFLRSLFGS